MFLLLTRPLLDSKKTKSILKKYGHRVYIEPMFKIKYLNTKLIQNFDIILSTSSNSIRSLNRILQKRDCSIITVGDSTMKVAREFGFTNVVSVNGNVMDLVSYIKEFYSQELTFLYVRGQTISFNLKEVLIEKGFSIEETILYEAINRKKLTEKCKKLLMTNSIDGTLFFSNRTAKIFCSLLESSNALNSIKNMTAYSMSKKITENLASYCWKNIITSSQPTQESVLNCINKSLKMEL